jgi:DNA polymerase-1
MISQPRHFIFDTLKLPVAAYTETKAASLDGNALMDMIFMLENKLEDPDEEKYLEAELPEGWETIDVEKDPTLDKATRMRIRIAKRDFHPYKDIGIRLLELMRKIQKYATLLSSHIEGREKHVNPVDGRIHANYEPWTETARLASMNPNGQNVPRPDNDALGVRNFYKAAPGKVLILEDESGFELRLTAWKSSCPVMLPAFINKEDMHRKTAATMLEKDPKDVTKHERSSAKAANFGSVYGGTEYALQQTFKKDGIRRSLPFCKLLVDAVKKTYPGIPRYQVEAVVKARETGYSETIYGFKRLLPHINGSNRYDRSQDERRAQNTPIQGSAADIMKKAQSAIYEKIGLDSAYFNQGALFDPWEGFSPKLIEKLKEAPFMQHGRTDMVAQIHDEIISELDDDVELVKKYAYWQKEVMEIPPLPGFPLPLEAEASAAYSWGQKMSLEKYLELKEGK